MDHSNGVTYLLQAALNGEGLSDEQAIHQVISTLREVAARIMFKERNDHLLQPTALVNEAWLRLAGQEGIQLKSRIHFTALATRVMRRILVDQARARDAGKRANQRTNISLEHLREKGQNPFDLLALDEELSLLEKLDARQCHIAQMSFFGGMTGAEIALVLELSPALVSQELKNARVWLITRLQRGGP